MPAYKWPDDMVDESRLYEILGHKSGDSAVVGPEASQRIKLLTDAVERARISGRLKRLTIKNSKTGEVMAYGYRRADVKRIVGMA